jgi:hypothetical protein
MMTLNVTATTEIKGAELKELIAAQREIELKKLELMEKAMEHLTAIILASIEANKAEAIAKIEQAA